MYKIFNYKNSILQKMAKYPLSPDSWEKSRKSYTNRTWPALWDLMRAPFPLFPLKNVRYYSISNIRINIYWSMVSFTTSYSVHIELLRSNGGKRISLPNIFHFPGNFKIISIVTLSSLSSIIKKLVSTYWMQAAVFQWNFIRFQRKSWCIELYTSMSASENWWGIAFFLI